MFKRRFVIQLLALSPFFNFSKLFASEHNEIDGDVFVNGERMTEKTLIKKGDLIETTKNSSVRFKINRDAFLLRKNSKFKIENTQSKTFTLLTGAVLGVFGKEKATVNTPTVTAGIRGTGMYIETEDSENSTYVCTCYGEIEYDFVGGKKLVKTKHHDSPYRFVKSGEKVIVKEAPVINHNDDELIALEEMHDRLPPFIDRLELIKKRMRGIFGGSDDGGGGY